MTSLFVSWFFAAGTVGPVLDAIDGTTVSAEDRFLIPSPRSLTGVADMWFGDVVGMQTARGDVARFDPAYMSSHGRSWTQMRYFLEELELTDPARPGLPLLEVPFEGWDSLTYSSLFTRAPGFRWRFRPDTRHARAVLGGGDAIGGGTWLPQGVLDREPGFRAGASRERRKLKTPFEATLDVGEHQDTFALRVAGEYLDHQHEYLRLEAREEAWRATLVTSAEARIGALPLSLVGAFISEHRTHAGAQFGFEDALTHDARGTGGAVRIATSFSPRDKSKLALGLSLLTRSDQEDPNGDAPYVLDLEDEWFYLARPRPAQDLSRTKVAADGVLSIGSEWTVRLDASRAVVHERPEQPGGRLGITYDYEVERTGPKQGVYQIVYDDPARSNEALTQLRLGSDYETALGTAKLRATLAVDLSGASARGGDSVYLPGPAAGVALRRSWGGAEIYGLVRYEPEPLTREVSSFLDPTLYNGTRSLWLDDGDGIPEADEVGDVRARTGGAYHAVADGLRRPKDAHLALGIKTGRFGPFRLLLQGTTRYLVDRFTVRTRGARYSAQPFFDPGGDGRGEIPASGGVGQDLTTYAQDPSTFGRETYVLTNAERADFFYGLDLQFFSVDTTRWFLNLNTSAYFSAGGAPFGSYPDRNDPGIIDETSGNPNERVNQRGRYDHDRSFAINLMTGVKPIEDLLAAINLRYRDGQPFNRIVVDESLPQGPTAIMAVRRGKPRYTFHMEMAARLQYTAQVAEHTATLRCDVLNLLGSGTELLEDPRTGRTYRDAVEVVPGRAIFFTAIFAWAG